ncbi:MAG: hypothetical protein ABIJ45_02105, partial [Candidatus Zixiibacteriota bacterium]
MRKAALLFVVFLMLLSFSNGYSSAMRTEATPLLGPGYIEVGVPFTIDIYMNNDDFDVYGYSWPLIFYSPDLSISTVIHRNVSGYSVYDLSTGLFTTDSSILMPNGFDTVWS